MKLSELRRLLFDAGIEEAAEEARLIFSHISGIPTSKLYGDDPECNEGALAELARRRAAHEPLGYLLGEVPFYRGTLLVGEGCLVPRADTERLVELAVSRLPWGARFCDLGTGSGAIAVSVLAERPDTTAVATDLSEAALAFAGRNALRLGVSARLTLLSSDMMREEPPGGPFDAILSNPPYIESGEIDTLMPEVLSEPRMALDGGEDGLSFYRRILSFSHLLREGGFFLLECGWQQGDAMAALAQSNRLSFTPYYDYGNRFRGCLLTKA